MKSLFVTLIIVGLLFLGYDYFLAPPWDRMVFQRAPAPEQVPQPSEQDQNPAAAGPAKPAVAASRPQRASQSQVGQPSTAPLADAPTIPKSAEASAKPGATPDGFQPPKFETIETLTHDWQKIPPKAFGRIVKLSKPVVFKLPFGESKVPAGSPVAAVGEENGLLLVSPSADSTVRTPVALEDSDFKQQLVEGYENWKVARTEALKHQFERRKLLEKNGQVAVVKTPTDVDDTGKPVRRADGTYPILLAKMRSGDVSEITPLNITKWGDANQETIEGVPTWTIDVTYSAKTMFGIQTVDTLARVQGGRVVSWTIVGSGEPVL